MRNSHSSKSRSKAARGKTAIQKAPTPGRRERRATQTRLKLFHVALRLFAERGFQNVTVEDITEGADVGKGTFFNYFQSKDHVLGVMTELQIAHVRNAVAAAASGKASIQHTLHRLFLSLAAEPGRSPNFARTIIGSFLVSGVVREIIEGQMREGRHLCAKVIAEGQRRGEIDRKLKSEEAALEMQQLLLGTVLVWSLHGKPALKTWVEGSFRLFWRAIAAKGKGRKP